MDKQAAFLMRSIVLPILEQREAVSFDAHGSNDDRIPPSSPQNALGWPVFDREGRLMAVAVALDRYLVGELEKGKEADSDARGRRGGTKRRRYAAFGVEEERQMVNLCAQVRIW